tara:strand:- start:77 stop:274 length:198 start_codon:yes stop_codon:yes gene_type:complete
MLDTFIKVMNKENLASIITRLYFCNNTKLEDKEEYIRMKKDLLALNDNEFSQKLWEFGFYDKEAS